jgi:hypothetical protein
VSATRDLLIEEIKQRYPTLAEQKSAWASLDLTGLISDEEWADDHAGVCSVCGARARLYAMGWMCEQHKPRAREAL